MSVGLGTAIGYLSLDSSGFARGVDSALSDMQRLEGNANSMSGALTTVGSALTAVGGALTAGITAPVVAATAASVKFGAEFDSQMSSVKAVSGATTEEFGKMREAAIKWGEKTVYTATEAGEALYYMSLAGWDTEAAINGLGPVLNLAAAGNLDLGRTSDIVTDAMTAMKLSAGELNEEGIENTIHFTNALSAAMSNSNTDIDQMGEAFKYVAPLAGSLGFSVNDLALALGLMANVGVKSSQAGTGLRQALNGLINPTDKAKGIMDQYGISLSNADGSTKSLRQVMLELRSTFGDVGANATEINKIIEDLGVDLDTTEGQTAATSAVMEQLGHDLPVNDMEKLNAIINIFGIRALPGVLGIIEQSDEAFNELAAAIDGSDEAFVRHEDQIYTMQEALEQFGDAVYNDDSFEILGSAAGMAETQMDNLKGDWTKLMSALGTSQIIISDMVNGVLRDFVQKLIELVQWFNNLDEGQREQIMKMVALAAAIGPVLLAVGKFITTAVKMYNTFMQLKSALTIVQGALAGISAPILLIIAVIAVLVAAFVTLWKTNEDFRNKIIEIWEGIKAKFGEAGQRIVDIVNQLGFDFENFGELVSAVLEVLKVAWQSFCEFLAPIFTGAFNIIATIIGGIVDFVVGIIEIIVGIIKGFKDGDWSLLWQGVGDVVFAVVDTITGILDALGETIWNVIQTVANWFGADWNMTWEEAKQAVVEWFATIVAKVLSFVEKITGFFTTIWNTVTTICNLIWDVIKTVWEGIGSTIITVITTIWEAISSTFQMIWEIISTVMQTIWEIIKTAWETISSTVSTIVTTIWQVVSNIFETIREIISTVMQAIWETISAVWETISSTISEVLGIIWQIISTIFQTILETISTVLQTIWETNQTVWRTISSTIKTIVTTIWNTIKSVFNSIWQTITTIVNGIKETITNVFSAISAFLRGDTDAAKEYLKAAWETIKNTFNTVLNNIKNIFTTIWNAIQTVITTVSNAIQNIITTVWNAIETVITTVLNAIKTVIDTVWNGILDVITTVVNGIQKVVTTVFDKVKTTITTVVNAILTTVKNVFDKIKTAITDALNKAKEGAINMMQSAHDGMKNVFKNVASTFAEIGKNIIQGIINGITGMLSNLYDSIKSGLSGLVGNAKNELGIKSPSRVFRDSVGKWIPLGIAEGFADSMPDAIDDMEKSLEEGVDDINSSDTDISVGITEFADTYKQVLNDLVIWFETAEERMAKAIEGLTDYFKYLMNVRQTLSSDDEFRSFILDEGESSNKYKKQAIQSDTVSNASTGKGGDTFVFYSPKAINEVQAARLLKNTKRNLAEGF